MADVKVPFPLRGLSDAAAVTEQPSLTARVAENVRAVDEQTGRVRGGVRPGTTKYVAGEVDTTNSRKVVDIQSISVDQPNVSWTRRTYASREDTVFAGTGPAYALEVDAAGDVYAVEGRSTIRRYNSLLEEQEVIPVPVGVEDHQIRPIQVDEVFNIYVADVQFRDLENDSGTISFDARAGDQEKTRIWKFRRSTITGKYELDWEIKTNAFVHGLRYKDGSLYTVQNDVAQNKSRIVVYGALSEIEPKVLWTRENIPYPCHDIDVNAEGDIYTAHEQNSDRGSNPKYPGFTQVRGDGWTPKNLSDWQERVWAWFRPETIEEDNPGIEDGDEIEFWRDSSGNGRHLYRDFTDAAWEGPVYRKEGVAGLPSVEFQGEQWLTSGPNITTANSGDSMQATILPSSLDSEGAGASMFCMMATIRPDFSSTVGALIGYRNATGGGSDHVVLTNRKEGSDTPGSASAGYISLFEDGSASTQVPHGDNSHPLAGWYGNSAGDVEGPSDGDFSESDGTWDESSKTLTSASSPFGSYSIGTENVGDWIEVTAGTGATAGFYKIASVTDSDNIVLETSLSTGGGDLATGDIAFTGAHHVVTHAANDVGTGVLTWMCDTGIRPTSYGDGVTRSLFRFNGAPLDRWESPAMYTEAAVDLGRYNQGSLTGLYYKGQVRELITFAPKSGSTLGASPNDEVILSHPGYDPWGVSGESAISTSTSDEMMRAEGYMAWRAGIGHLLDPPADLGFPHPYKDVAPVPEDEDNGVSGEGVNELNGSLSLTCKWSGADGSFVWANDSTFGTDGGNGYSVRAGLTTAGVTQVYTFGPGTGGASEADQQTDNKLKGFLDEGDDYSVGGGDGWETLDDFFPIDPLTKLEVDDKGNVYACICQDNDSTTKGAQWAIYDADGNQLCEEGLTDGTGPVSDAATTSPYFAIHPKFRSPQFPSSYSDDESPEQVYVAGYSQSYDQLSTQFASGVLTISNVIDPALSSAEERSLVTLAVADGQILKQSGASWAALTGGGTTGAPLWTYTDARYVSSTPYVGGGKVYVFYTNGFDYYYYDALEDEVAEFRPTSGTIADRFRLFSTWRGRLVGCRTTENPQYWAMSAVGAPFDWQFNPAVITVTQAIDGVNAEAGEVPDIVNGFVPYSDDVGIFGGDHSIWRLSGDPMMGGQFDSITKSIGMTFGKAWCIDDDGTVFFYGTNGAFYRMRPGDIAPVRMSSNTIEARLNDIDQGDYFIRMEYDVKRQGIWVAQCPYGQSESTAPKSWFWDKRNGDEVSGWWQDQFTNSDHTITALATIDGDSASDRTVVFGSQDSYVRKWSNDTDDDGSALVSRVVFGPLVPSVGKEYRAKQPSVVLASDQGGAVLELYGDNDPTFLGAPLASAQLKPGRNEVKYMKARGAHIYAGLRSKEGWSMESMNVKVHSAGGAKLRA